MQDSSKDSRTTKFLMKHYKSLDIRKQSKMISLKQRWNWFRRSQKSESNIVRSNSFTLQLSPKYFENVQSASSSSTKLQIKELSSSDDSIKNNVVMRHNRMQHGSQRVRYIFSVPLTQRPTTFHMLQRPLKKVYLAYMNKHYASVPAILQITSSGLRCQHVKCDGTDVVDSFNQFQTIAFWAAVQCVVRTSTSKDGKSGLRMGFFPFAENGQCLIEEDDDSDEREPLLSQDTIDGSGETVRHFILLSESETNWNLLQVEHQPFFVCVMRMNVPPHALQCHVFLCSSSQQAITLASSLYNKLSAHISHMKLRQDMRLLIRSGHGYDKTKEGFSRIHKAEDHQRHSRMFRCRLNDTTNLKTTICGLCKREYSKKSFGGATPSRSKSFSQLLVRLRRLTLGDVVQSSSTLSPIVTQHDPTGYSEDTLERGESSGDTEEQGFRARVSLLTNVEQSSDDSVFNTKRSNGLLPKEMGSFRKDLHSRHVMRCRSEQHPHRQRPNLPTNTPLWLKFLLELGLRQSSQSVHKPLLSSSRFSRTKTTNRNREPFRPHIVPVTRNLTDWLSFENSKATTSDHRHSEVVTPQVIGSWSRKCNPRFTTHTRRNSNDEAYAEILETMVSCEQRPESHSDIVSFDTSSECSKVLNLSSNVFEANKSSGKLKADETACMKKDAEIVSILEQITQKKRTKAIVQQLEAISAREEPLLSQSGSNWGCSSFLP